jgi:hypothetical protein
MWPVASAAIIIKINVAFLLILYTVLRGIKKTPDYYSGVLKF